LTATSSTRLSETAVLTGPAGVPDKGRTVGFHVLDWCWEYIRQPDGPNAGGPFELTQEQARFVLWWYAFDESGRWVFDRGVLRRSKGWGKSPVVAAMGLAELCGPVRWTGRVRGDGTAEGQAVSAAWVQLAGVSEKQTTNTMSMVLAMCTESPVVDDYGLDLGLTRIYTAAGGRLEPITASAPTAEGARPTFVIEDETHHWTDSNGGSALDNVNRRNVAKIPGGTGRVLETTNAHASGMGSVAEKSYDAWLAMQEGRTRSSRLLYDAREAPADVDMGDEAALLAGLAAAYGDSTWVDLERIRDEVWDPSTPPEDSRRFYLNQISSAVDAWLSEPEWNGCTNAAKVVADRDVVTLGFDGSQGRTRGVADATALIGCRVSDGHLFEIGVWEQPSGPAGRDWTVPASQVDAAVRMAFDRWQVVGFFADPAKWESYIAQWEAAYHSRLRVKATQNHPIHWWTKPVPMVRALDDFHTAVVNGELTHDGSFALTRHALNARRRVGPSGVQISKEHPDSARKIDAVVASVLAWQARLAAVAAGLGRSVGVPRRIR
jgi:hypothetical protein